VNIWQCDWSYYTIFDLVLRMHPSVPVCNFFLLFVVCCFVVVVVVVFIITIVNYDGEEDGIGIYTSCFALSRRNLATIWQCDWSYYTIFDLVLRMHPSVPVPSIFFIIITVNYDALNQRPDRSATLPDMKR